ncbi:MAG: hypothetical protein O8C59_00545 [Candidatus Methanoperedens sp.]|nr:hypothetical protein [Candidatus Methanoperedens sp.]
MALYETIIEILAEEMGPAATSFFAKQCKTLNKEPGSITNNDIDALASGLYSGIKPILGDDIADKINKKILSLKS